MGSYYELLGYSMIRSNKLSAPDHNHEHQELLQSLLEQAPESSDQLRPVTLYSIEEERRQALKSFKQRTWFDSVLYYAERLLVGILGVFLLFWFLDGYGRDWLYEHGYISYEQATGTIGADAPNQNTPYTSMSSYQTHNAEIPNQQAMSLPFTQPDANRPATTADYFVPQSVTIPDEPDDKRPYHMLIPALDLDTPVTEVFVHNGVWQVADYATGYHHGTALPGENGNTVMAGHAGWRGSVFRDLGNLQSGDTIFVDAGGWRYRYQVSKLERVWPTQVEVMAPTSTPVLTLITCTDLDTKRLIVQADLVGSRPIEGVEGK